MRHEEREQHGVGEDVEQHRGQVGRVEQDLGHVLERQVAVDEHGDEEGVHRAHRGGLGRGEHPGIDAADDDDDQHQAPEALAERPPALSPARLRRAERRTAARRCDRAQGAGKTTIWVPPARNSVPPSGVIVMRTLLPGLPASEVPLPISG